MDVPGTYSLSARSPEEQIALQAIAGLSPLERPDAVLLVTWPDWGKAVENAAWVKPLAELGAIVPIWPVRAHELPRWLQAWIAVVTLASAAALVLSLWGAMVPA